MKSQLATLLSRQGARPVSINTKAMRTGDGDPRHYMGMTHLRLDQPVAYFLFHNRHAAELNETRPPGMRPAVEFMALACNIASRRAFDDLMPVLAKAYHVDADQASIGDLVLMVGFMPGFPPAPGQDYRSNLPHVVTLEPVLNPESTGGRRPVSAVSARLRAGGG